MGPKKVLAGGSVTKAMRRHVILVAAVTALGGLLLGYDTGGVSGPLLFLHRDFGTVSSFDKELVVSLLLVGAVVGALGAGRIADKIGRRPTLMATAVVFIVGVIVTISSLTLLGTIHGFRTFFLLSFLFLTLFAVFYCVLRVPETKGESLQQIERELR